MNKNIKIVLTVAITVLLLLTCTAYYYLYETEYGVLFDDLRGEDVTHVVEVLKKENIDYKLSGDGSQLMIEQRRLEDIRSEMVLNQLSNSNEVGFELFDNTDIGMTEFAQKLNHQRALQGELAKTISAFPEVKYARIHLVLPENKLFGKKDNTAKASVSLFLNQGMTLSNEQIRGVKKLVAASVPDLTEANVVVNDQNGIVLGKKMADDAIEGSNRLELKQKAERYFINKIKPVLEHMYGSGNALMTIDVDLQLDEITLVKEGILPAGKKNAGTLLRKKESTSSNSGLLPQEKGSKTTTNKVVEVEYQYGKKIENIVVKPGNIAKISVGVLLPGKSDKATRQSISNIIAMAIGLDTDRGDSIKVHFSGDLAGLKNESLVNTEAKPNMNTELTTESSATEMPVNIQNDMIEQKDFVVESVQQTPDIAVPKLPWDKPATNYGLQNMSKFSSALLGLLLIAVAFFVIRQRNISRASEVVTMSLYERQENYELVYKWLTANQQYEK